MANGDVFNISKGCVGAYHDRVKNGDPSTSRIGVMALATTGLESDTTLIRKATLAAVVAGTTNEAVNSGYARVTFTAAQIPARTVDNALDQGITDLPDAALGTVLAGDSISKLVVFYIPIVGTSTDSDCVPMTLHDFFDANGNPIVPNGTVLQAVITGYFKAIKGT